MRKPRREVVILLVALGGAAIISYSLPTRHRAIKAADPLPAAPPNELLLTGIVRDFSRTHPDFERHDTSAGVIAGNLALKLDASGKPKYTGAGYAIRTPWLDAANHHIAPHMYNVFDVSNGCYIMPGIAVNGIVDLNNQSVVDSFDSRRGPYSTSNRGSAALVATNSTSQYSLTNRNSSDIYGSILAGPGGDLSVVYQTHPACRLTGTKGTLPVAIPMPVIFPPADLGPSIGDRTYLAGVTTISTDLHVNNLALVPGSILRTHGERRILVEGNLLVEGEIRVEGTLRLYVRGSITFETGKLNMNTGDPGKCTLYKMGAGQMLGLGNESLIVARIVSPQAGLTVRQGSEIFGTLLGDSITLDNKARFHVDQAYSGPLSFMPDRAGARGSASLGAVTSASSFDQWFSDVLGVNRSGVHVITLPLRPDGFYEYATNDFHPIDDDLLGNEGDAANHNFTYAIDARFQYRPCSGQMIEFEGDDDAWIFIDGTLVMDRGGLQPGAAQYVDVDRLGLAPAEDHRLLFLYAQRQPTQAYFRLRTNLVLVTEGVVPSINASYD